MASAAEFVIEEPEDIDELREFFPAEDEELDIPPLSTTFEAAIAVRNIPVVDEAKAPKLEGVLRKIYSQCGTIRRINMPRTSAGKTQGFAFVEFATAKEATLAQKRTHDYKLDKNHVFDVMLYSEMQRVAAVPDDYQEPPEPPARGLSDALSWLSDSHHRDQYVVRFDNETVVNWCEVPVGPEEAYGGEREKAGGKHWCELYVEWSPQGSYLATFHRPGIALWGGSDFAKQGRLAHANCTKVVFSPCERFVLTCNFREGDPAAVIIWDVKESRALRSFELSKNVHTGHANAFQWSHDGNYIARLGQDKAGDDVIQIYETPTMGLLDKKTLRAKGVREFCWSPTDNTIAFWGPEFENTPARVSLVQIPSRQELRQKNLFNVFNCRLMWQPAGDFLSVKVIKHTKSKKTQFNSFEFFRIRDNLVPVEMLEIKDRVHAMSWEPNGDRFALVHGGDPGNPSVSFYSMSGPPGVQGGGGKKGKGMVAEEPRVVTLLTTLTQRACTHIYWSPLGGHCVLAGHGDYQGVLEFYDVDALPEKGHQVDHYRCNAVEWDPSGRMVTTSVTQPLEGATYKYQMDNGFQLWTFQGEPFYETQMEKFYQFMWRPRPKSLLSADEKRKIKKNLRKFERRFERADHEKKKERERVALRSKQLMREQFRARMAERTAAIAALTPQRIAARGGFDEGDSANWIVTEVVFEEVVEIKETLVDGL